MEVVQRYGNHSINPSCPFPEDDEIRQIIKKTYLLAQRNNGHWNAPSPRPRGSHIKIEDVVFGVLAWSGIVGIVGFAFYGIKKWFQGDSLGPDNIVDIMSKMKIPEPHISVEVNPAILASINQKLCDLSTDVAKLAAVIKGPTLEESSAVQCLLAAGGKAGAGVATVAKSGVSSVWNYFQGK